MAEKSSKNRQIRPIAAPVRQACITYPENFQSGFRPSRPDFAQQRTRRTTNHTVFPTLSGPQLRSLTKRKSWHIRSTFTYSVQTFTLKTSLADRLAEMELRCCFNNQVRTSGKHKQLRECHDEQKLQPSDVSSDGFSQQEHKRQFETSCTVP